MSCAQFLPDIALCITTEQLDSDHRIFCVILKSLILSFCQLKHVVAEGFLKVNVFMNIKEVLH